MVKSSGHQSSGGVGPTSATLIIVIDISTIYLLHENANVNIPSDDGILHWAEYANGVDELTLMLRGVATQTNAPDADANELDVLVGFVADHFIRCEGNHMTLSDAYETNFWEQDLSEVSKDLNRYLGMLVLRRLSYLSTGYGTS